ncbi:MAG: hypothetical protein QXJ32_03825 [Thermoplasmata archaeon]
MKLRKNKKKDSKTTPDDFVDNYSHKQVVEFHPHCYVQQLALAEAKRFDEFYALAHHPVLGEEEESEA